MRTHFKNIGLAVALTIAVILLELFMYYNTVCSAPVVQSSDIYGTSSISDMTSIRNRQRMISQLTGNTKADKAKLEAYALTLDEYLNAANFILKKDYHLLGRWYDIPLEDRKAHVEKLYQKCLAEYSSDESTLIDKLSGEISDIYKVTSYIDYIENYGEYVSEIAHQSEFLTDISIYKDDSSIVGNIVKTQKDFYGLSEITLTPVIADGYYSFIGFRVADLLAILVSVVSLLAIKGGAVHRRRVLLAPALICLLGTAAIYVGNYILTDIFIGLPPADVNIQSMENFKSCPYVINVGIFALYTVLMKLAGCLVIMFTSALIISLSGRKRIAAAVVSAAAIAAEAVFAFVPESPLLLKEINIFSFFAFERFFIRYLNFDIFGITVSRLPVFVGAAAFILLLTALAASRSISSHEVLRIRETEQHYYDEINRRYAESRKIRHDINNHLLAISALIETGSIEQAKRYISEVSEQTDLAAMPAKTGSDVLDALLFKKTEQAAEKGVTLAFEVNCPVNDSGISDYDLCAVFGNIIDNALEAVRTGDLISVNIGNQMDMLYISCENPYYTELKKRGDRLLTTKTDFISHGMGISRVRETAERCGGDVNITADNGSFLIEILMNNKKKSRK